MERKWSWISLLLRLKSNEPHEQSGDVVAAWFTTDKDLNIHPPDLNVSYRCCRKKYPLSPMWRPPSIFSPHKEAGESCLSQTLIVMSPKSLLRLSLNPCLSPGEEFWKKAVFRELIIDSSSGRCKTLIFCSGQVYMISSAAEVKGRSVHKPLSVSNNFIRSQQTRFRRLLATLDLSIYGGYRKSRRIWEQLHL